MKVFREESHDIADLLRDEFDFEDCGSAPREREDGFAYYLSCERDSGFGTHDTVEVSFEREIQ